MPATTQVQSPVLVTRSNRPTSLEGLYDGQTAFLIASGPSLLTHDLSQLSARGILTLAVNNAGAVFRPQLWVCLDSPGRFCDAIWRDPGITKFVPEGHLGSLLTVRDSEGRLIYSHETPRRMPAVFGYVRNEDFVPERWLSEDSFNCGQSDGRRDCAGNSGSRSVMYVALRLLYYLGLRRVYLVGCDFRMAEGRRNYAFPQHRTRASVASNNRLYATLNQRLRLLRPYFDAAGYQIFNCTPASGLTVFPYVPFEEAVACARAVVPRHIDTAGMYSGTPVRRRKGGKG
jgi:hypothetical protein